MGLDMYAMKTKVRIDQPVDFKIAESEELHYWRKHPNLHGWMQDLYYAKGGTEDFNCVPVELATKDLDRLEAAIRNQELPYTTGFFFGSSEEQNTDGDLEFIRKARQAIAEGYGVFYDSWW